MKNKAYMIALISVVLLLCPTKVNAETVSENEIYDDVPAVIDESALDGTPVISDEVEALTEEESAETLSGANNTSADFIERLYNVALDRPSEEAGKQDWLNRLNEGSTGSDLAKGFLYSQEFLNKGTSNDQFLTVLYKTFFDRDPDEAGKAGWMKALNEGTSRQQIVDGFIGSQEYSNLCATYGINAGTGVNPSIDVKPNEATIAFVTRLYKTCLNREPDEEGLNYWSKALANQSVSGTEVANGFFFSPELNNNDFITPTIYTTKLYRAFFDREPDEAGLLNWKKILADGPRRIVFNGFALSEEWRNTCAKYGITCGYPEGTENNPTYPKDTGDPAVDAYYANHGHIHQWHLGAGSTGHLELMDLTRDPASNFYNYNIGNWTRDPISNVTIKDDDIYMIESRRDVCPGYGCHALTTYRTISNINPRYNEDFETNYQNSIYIDSTIFWTKEQIEECHKEALQLAVGHGTIDERISYLKKTLKYATANYESYINNNEYNSQHRETFLQIINDIKKNITALENFKNSGLPAEM